MKLESRKGGQKCPPRTCSVTQQDSQIAQIVASWASHDSVAERIKKRISVEADKAGGGIQPTRGCTLDRRAVRDRAGCATVAVNTVRASAKHRDVVPSNFLSAR